MKCLRTPGQTNSCLRPGSLSTKNLLHRLAHQTKKSLQKKSPKELILSLQTKCKKKTQTNCNVLCFLPFNSRTVVYLFDQKAMMIKHTLSLSIDNSDDDWICIHTPIPDYQMAYHINKIFSVLLRRRPEDYASKQAGQKFPSNLLHDPSNHPNQYMAQLFLSRQKNGTSKTHHPQKLLQLKLQKYFHEHHRHNDFFQF